MKKVLAIMLVCFMLVSLLPMGALAAEVEQETPDCKGQKHYLDTCESTFYAKVEGECGGYDYNVYTCNACGDYFAADFVKISGEHEFEETKAPTCTEAGEQKCSICDKKEPIEALGHKGTGATCTEASVCERCGEKLEANTAHNFGEKPSAIVKEPNEETRENGLAEYTCEDCGFVKEVVILAHQCTEFTFSIGFVDGKIGILGVDPTCTEPGLKPHGVCNDCGRYWILELANNSIVPVKEVTKAELETPAAGHVKGEAVDETVVLELNEYGKSAEITATADIVVRFQVECADWYVNVQDNSYGSFYTVDGGQLRNGADVELTLKAGVTYRLYSFATGIAKITATFKQGPVTVLGDCHTESVCKYTCAVCGEKVEESLGVNHTDFVVEHEIEATCTKFGYKIVSCVACGYNDIEVTAPLGHDECPENEEDYTYYAPTCSEEGYYEWYCTGCDEYIQSEPIPATGCDLVTVTFPATCGQYGYSITFCSRTLEYATRYSCPTSDDYSAYMSKISDGEITITLPYSLDLTCVREDGTEVVLYNAYREYILVDYKINVEAGFDKNVHNEADKAKGQVIEPACGVEGLIIYWCTDCEAAVYEPIDALEHEFDDENLIITYPTCDEPGVTAHKCTLCGYIETIKTEEFTSEYVYMDYESAAKAHNLENSIKEVFRPGICGEQAALDRYLCLTCMQYILVKDDSFEKHVMPEGLLSKDDPENQVEELVPVDFVFTGSFEDEDTAYDGDYPTFVAPFDGYATIIKSTGCSVASFYGGNVVAGQTYKLNPYISNINFANGITSYEVTIHIEPTAVVYQEFCGVDATCMEDGYTAQYYCLRCSNIVKSEPIKANGKHNEVIDVPAKDATCTEAGATKGWHCADCDAAEESVIIPATGHNPILIDSAEWEENKQYGYEHYMCETCQYEYIINYVGVCIHEWNTRADRDLSVDATCEKDGYKAYKCKNCDAVKYETIDRKHHTNAAGQDLEFCGTETEDLICDLCKKEFEIPDHNLNNGVAYPANCLSNAYIIYTCQNEGCTHYEVEEIEDTTGAHTWSVWAPVLDDNGVIVAESRGCSICGTEERRPISEIAYSATIENKANAEMGIADGTMIKVTISVSGAEDNMWGFHLNVDFSENLIFVGHKFVTENFTYAQIASEHDGYITVLANADGDVTLNGQEEIIELYFEVVAPEASEIWVNFSKFETLKAEAAEGESNVVAARAYGASAETVELMELDGFEGITLADALALYNLIAENDNTNVAADLDKDGYVTLADYLYLYSYIAGEMSYEQIVALRSIVSEG